ncbi:MAG TPA: heavy metal translocating P-type ATPase [Candidatus Saccharibacteria bacterium]|nr:heavy metal translocating P-type ATPase [Candidatus Saccharibacteria bacterium]
MRNVLRKFVTFFKEYRQFGFVLFTIIDALVLYALGYKSAAHIVLIFSALVNVIPLVWGMIQNLRMGIYGVDILAATAIVSAVLFREYWAGIVIVFMLTGGEALEDYAETRAKAELSDLLNRAPTKAHVFRGRKEIDVPVAEVRAGDKILIKPGEVVPVDAIILTGTANFDESSLTGESLPVVKTVNQDVLSGSINLDGSITAKALHSAADSQYEQIIKLVKSAEASKAPFVRMADRYSIPFTLLAFSIALGAWALSGDSMRFLEVLVVATPCPLILGAPIALISGMSRAAKHGIIIKTGSALEQLAAAKTIGFDKTGTLTMGKPIVKQVSTFGTFSNTEVVSAAASLEQSSNHVLAQTVVDYAEAQNIKAPRAKHVVEISGKGLKAHIGGKEIFVGRLTLMQQESVEIPKSFNPTSFAQTAAFVAIDGVLAGAITFEDELRSNSKATLQRLKKLGIKHMLMVTGDNKVTAAKIAKQLGIDQVTAEALPADKLKAVESLVHRPVAFVGDGVNDAPVLAAADVGIALGARGSTAASESADIVIMVDNIERVADGVAIARRTFFIAKQSILTGIFLSVILMFVFSTGRFKPVYGAAVQEVVDVVVILNALRAHGSWRKKKSFVSAVAA